MICFFNCGFGWNDLVRVWTKFGLSSLAIPTKNECLQLDTQLGNEVSVALCVFVLTLGFFWVLGVRLWLRREFWWFADYKKSFLVIWGIGLVVAFLLPWIWTLWFRFRFPEYADCQTLTFGGPGFFFERFGKGTSIQNQLSNICLFSTSLVLISGLGAKLLEYLLNFVDGMYAQVKRKATE